MFIEDETTKDNTIDQVIAFLEEKKYNSAFDLINDNISEFCHNIETLQDYLLRIGAKNDDKERMESM